MKRRIISLFLALIMVLSSVSLVFATDNQTQPVQLDKGKIGNVDAKLQKLADLNLIPKEEVIKYKEDRAKEESKSKKYQYQEVYVIQDQEVLFAVDSKTGEPIDVDQLIAETESKAQAAPANDQVTVQSSVFVFPVSFLTFIGNPGTTYADFVNSVQVLEAIGVGTKPTNYTLKSKIMAATSSSGSYSTLDDETN